MVNSGALRKTALTLFCFMLMQVITGFFGKLYWLNFTHSEPLGLYKMIRPQRGVQRGDMVVFNIPVRFRSYVYGRKWLPKGIPFLKHVGAVPGDIYCVADGIFKINGVPVGPVYSADQDGLPLPNFEGCGRVPEGFFVPVATLIKTSFDGRYMGPVSVSEIRGIVRPVWVFQ
jgi:conjugative transfer signal peptidase TraF